MQQAPSPQQQQQQIPTAQQREHFAMMQQQQYQQQMQAAAVGSPHHQQQQQQQQVPLPQMMPQQQQQQQQYPQQQIHHPQQQVPHPQQIQQQQQQQPGQPLPPPPQQPMPQQQQQQQGGHHHPPQQQPPQQQGGGGHPQAPLSASASHQESVLQRVCEIFRTSFGRDEAQCRAEGRKYLLTRVIGHGATGVVLNAKSMETGQSYAVKIVEVGNMSSSDKDRAMAEVHSLIACNFFSVLKCHDDYVQYSLSTRSSNNTDAQKSSSNVLGADGGASAGAATDPAAAANPVAGGGAKEAAETLIVSSSSNPHPQLTNNLLNKEPKMLALVVDLANAGDLRQEIKNRARRNRPFKEHEVGLLFIQILMAVHHVHCKHMIHRDIKTANVFLCSNGLVKLGDFGFSKQYIETVSTEVGRTFCGTPYYVAPEIWRRRPYSKKADMFSLGVLLYETLALKRPFEGSTMSEVMEKTLAGVYEPLPPSTSPEMQRIVRDLLNTDPSRRPSSAQLLQYPLSKLFMDALISIVQSHGHNTFDEAIRSEVNRNVAETRLTLKKPTSLAYSVGHQNYKNLNGSTSTANNNASQSANALASTSTNASSVMNSNQVIVNNMTLDSRLIYHEGMVHKLSGDGQWKRRYLCIFRNENPNYNPSSAGGAGGADGSATANNESSDANNNNNNNSILPPAGRYEYKLLIAITKETIRQQCIIAPCHEFEDVFPVPPRYAGSNAENVFSLVYRTGAKRLAFQAPTPEDQGLWMDRIQIALGIAEEEGESKVEIPL